MNKMFVTCHNSEFRTKKMSFCHHKLKFLNPFIFKTRCFRPILFQVQNSDKSKSQSLEYQWFTPSGCNKYQWFTPSGCTEIGIQEFISKTQFLYIIINCFGLD